MTKHTLHFETCSAPICLEDDTPDFEKNVLWYPGELVCGKRPFTLCQKRQSKINRWLAKGEFKHGSGYYFTLESLTNRMKIMKGTRGGDPDARQVLKQK